MSSWSCLLVQDNVTRTRRRLGRLQADFAAGRISAAAVRHRVASWIGHAAHADTIRLRRRLLGATSFTRGTGTAP
jgi:RNA-directed DNA polymerase